MNNIRISLILFIISYCLFNSILSDNIEDDPTKIPNSPEEFKNMYQKMLITKRKTQQEAVKRILDMKDSKKEKEMISIVLKKLFQTLESSLENLAKIQRDNKSPEGIKLDKETINHVSMIIENTAFASDLALHFPKNFHKLYDKNKNWQLILESSIGLTLKSNLIDEQTEKAINLMSQELNIIDKDPNFVNPYGSQKNFAEPVPEVEEKPKKKKKEKRKRGPGLSGGKAEL